MRRRLPDIEDLILGNEIFRARTRGVGVLTAELVHAYGVSGPIARASGVDLDLRRDEPYLAYGELRTCRSSTRTEGDCLARFEVLLEQVKVSLDLADACLDRLRALPPGPINQRLPKVLKVPEGHDLRLDREPAGHQRLLPGLARREDAVAAEAALGVVQQHPGAARAAARARWSPTWSRSSARCSSSSATSTSSVVGDVTSAQRRRRASATCWHRRTTSDP